MTMLQIERLGGFAGFGGPGAHLRSRGHVDLAQISAADRKAVDALFAANAPSAAVPLPDGFRYRLSRHGAAGPQVVEVAEGQVPQALRDAVRDELI